MLSTVGTIIEDNQSDSSVIIDFLRFIKYFIKESDYGADLLMSNMNIVGSLTSIISSADDSHLVEVCLNIIGNILSTKIDHSDVFLKYNLLDKLEQLAIRYKNNSQNMLLILWICSNLVGNLNSRTIKHMIHHNLFEIVK